MTYQLPSDTAYLHVETRQYELFGKKLGRDGIRRIVVVVALLIGVPWVFLIFILIGNPLMMLWLYVIPPALTVMLLTRPDKGGRVAYLALYDRALYLRRRRKRIIPTPGRGDTAVQAGEFTLQPILTVTPPRKAR